MSPNRPLFAAFSALAFAAALGFAGLAHAAKTQPMPDVSQHGQSTTIGTGPSSPGAPKSELRKEAPSFSQLDTNHDGKIEHAEIAAHAGLAAKFKKFDWNHNGTLSRKEYQAMIEQSSGQAPSSAAGESKKSDPDRKITASGAPKSSSSGASRKETFSSLDVDNNGVLTRNEAAMDPDKHFSFSQADKNHDGKLTRSEWERAKKSGQ